ncbi:ArsR/SmtB family transcription factor [Gimesia chilikensis]|uniref:ArsR/SmtB family transcription factor n=1 Tax=Gimesia chilikensis TaxID=2605989 RepID=UPI00396582DD
MKDRFKTDYFAERLKALGEPLRLRIVDLLRAGELTVSDICLFLKAEMVTVSHHLQILKNISFVSTRREGRYIYYRLDAALCHSGKRGDQTLDLGCCRPGVVSKL